MMSAQSALRHGSCLFRCGKTGRLFEALSVAIFNPNLDFCRPRFPARHTCYSTSVDTSVEPTTSLKSPRSTRASSQRIGRADPPDRDAIAAITPSGIHFIDNSTPSIYFQASRVPETKQAPSAENFQKRALSKLLEKFITSTLNSSIFVFSGGHRGVLNCTVFYESRAAAEKVGQLLDSPNPDDAGDLLAGWTIKRKPNIDVLWAVRTRYLYIPQIPRAPARHPLRGPGSDAETRRFRAFGMLVNMPGLSRAVRVRQTLIAQSLQFDGVVAVFADPKKAQKGRFTLNDGLRKNLNRYPNHDGTSDLPPYGRVQPAILFGWRSRDLRTLGTEDNIYLPSHDTPQHGERTLRELTKKKGSKTNHGDRAGVDRGSETSLKLTDGGLGWLPYLVGKRGDGRP